MKTKRIITLLICFAMILASIPTNLFSALAFATEGGSFYSSFEDNEDYSKYVHGKLAEDENGNPKIHGVSTGVPEAAILGEYIDYWDTLDGSEDLDIIYALENITDRDPATCWLTGANVPDQETPIWAEMKMKEEILVRTYSITSGNEDQSFDPKAWNFLGSKDGVEWNLLDSQTDQVFSDRQVINIYTFENETAYMYYRLEITTNYGDIEVTEVADLAMGSNEGESSASEEDTNLSISIGPKSSWTGNANQGWTGKKALEVTGTHEIDEHAYRYNTLYEGLNIPVGENTQLSYLIFPGNPTGYDYDYTSMYMAVDLLFTNGTYLSDLAAVDQYGHGMTAKEQGESKTLYTKQWNEIYSNIGDVAEGLTIDSILVVYDNPFEGTYESAPISFRSYFDDITIETVEPVVHEHLSDYVNILRGTNDTTTFSRGLTAPVVTVPNGFNFWAPATTNNGNKIYNYTDTSLTHITVSHEPSYWIGDRGTFQFMANTSLGSDASNISVYSRKATFSHDNEIANAHHYSVQFDEGSNASGVKMEVTPTDHAAAVRFSFPVGSENRNIIFDSVNASWDGSLEFSEDGKSFTAKTNHTGNGMTAMYIYGEFDVAASNKSVVNSGAAQGMASFPEGTTEVTMKIATSFISTDQAKHNLKLEISDSDTFDDVFERAQKEWDKLLGIVEIEGASYDQMVTFYSNMYRMYAYPNSLSENTGAKENPDWKYASPYKGGAVTDGILYYNNGFWDTYRTTWAAYALFTPEKNTEMLNGLVQHYDDQGWIPRWIAPGGVDCMVGTSSDVILGDAIMRGQEFDYDNAYLSAVRNASVAVGKYEMLNGGRSGLDTSIFSGYTSTDTGEGMSWALEGYINDYGIANMAKAMRDKVEDKESEEYQQYDDEYQYFLNRAQNYVNLFDDNIDFFQGKKADGSWRNTSSAFDPITWGYDYTETNAWNMAFTVPQDGQGLANLYGGREGLEKKLDEFFDSKGEYNPGSYGREIHEMREAREVKMGQYGHSNQPSHHIPYMYLYAGQPSKTQEKVREVLDRLYVGESIGQGYTGDEDNGEMSAWYVLSSLGIYPVNMGSGEFAIGSPLFTKATVHLENGEDLVINAPNNSSENIYVQGVKLNGESWNKTYFDHSDIAEGAVIDFEMGSTPSTWGTDEAALPTSITEGNEIAEPDKDITVTNPTILSSVPTENQSVDSIYVPESVTNPLSFSDNSSREYPFITTNTISLYYSFASDQNVNMYTITSGSDIQGAPSSWSLWGSNDNQNWVKLDERSNQTFQWGNYTRPFALDGTASFKNYRLDIDGTNGSEVLNISEIELLGNKEGFDRSLLQELVDEASLLEEKNYTPTTWSAMKNALEQAKKLLDDENATPAQLSEAYYNLKAAIEALEEADKVDKTALQALVDECLKLNRADYTEESWEEFSYMLTEAQNLLTNANASQNQINKMLTFLTNAKANLVPIPVDKTALQALVDECLNLNRADYTDESWEEFSYMLTEAQNLLTNASASQNQVNKMLTFLTNAKANLVPIPVDKSALKALVDECQELSSADYTDESWENFSEMLNEAVNTLNNETASQAQVDKAFTALTNAKANLVPIPVDKTALQALVDECNALNGADYTDESWQEFSEQLNEAQNLLANASASQNQVDKAFNALTNAKEALVSLPPKVDKSALQALVDECQELNGTDYTDESWQEFSGILNEAQNLLANASASQNQVDKAFNALTNAKEALVSLPPKVDKSALQALVDECQELNGTDYTNESWQEFSGILNEAVNILNNEAATQAQVDDAITALTNVKTNLVTITNPIDKTDLESEIAKAEVIESNLDKYEEAGKADFIAALKTAKEVLAKEDATQEEINAAMNLLKTSINALKLASEESSSTDSNSSNNSDAGKTGDTDLMYIVMIFLISLGLVACIAYKNKKSSYK